MLTYMGFNLKRFRKGFNLKQSDLAAMLGIPQSFISDIENGKASLPDVHYETLKEKYGEEVLEKYMSSGTGSINVQGDNNISYFEKREPASLNTEFVTIPVKAWAIIEKQANSLEVKDRQMDEVIAMLKERLKKERPAEKKKPAAKQTVG